MKKENEATVHVAQEPHSESDCRINEKQHSHPDVDCGHRVNEGPGTVNTPDLNVYDNDHGKKSIVAGGPKHNLDQAHGGPGEQVSSDLNTYADDHGKHAIVSGS